jgi:hypothetical protein
MTDYALNKEEKEIWCEKVQTVWGIRILWENFWTLRAFRIPVKNSIHQRFSI